MSGIHQEFAKHAAMFANKYGSFVLLRVYKYIRYIQDNVAEVDEQKYFHLFCGSRAAPATNAQPSRSGEKSEPKESP